MTKNGKKNRRGAVMVEYLVVTPVLLFTFFMIFEYSRMAQAKLVLKHGAIAGARAAAVLSNLNDTLPNIGGTSADVTRAVRGAIGPWNDSGVLDAQQVSIVDTSSRGSKDAPFSPVTVTVTANYTCSMPNIVGFNFLCNRTWTESATMAHQGARYRL